MRFDQVNIVTDSGFPPRVGDLWRCRTMDAYIKILEIQDDVLTVATSDIGLHAKDGPEFTITLGHLQSRYYMLP